MRDIARSLLLLSAVSLVLLGHPSAAAARLDDPIFGSPRQVPATQISLDSVFVYPWVIEASGVQPYDAPWTVGCVTFVNNGPRLIAGARFTIALVSRSWAIVNRAQLDVKGPFQVGLRQNNTKQYLEPYGPGYENDCRTLDAEASGRRLFYKGTPVDVTAWVDHVTYRDGTSWQTPAPPGPPPAAQTPSP